MSRSETKRAARQRPVKGVSPRRLIVLIALLILLGVGAFLWWWLTRPDTAEQTDAIEFTYFTPESTATVSFAGAFPPAGRPPIARPLGIDGDGERLFVAEADAGLISMRSYDGALIATFTVEPAVDAAAFYPVDVAILPDGTLGVVDTAGSRVVWIDPDAPERSGDLLGSVEVLQPTAIDASDTEVFVADAVSATILAFTLDEPAEIRGLGGTLDPPLSFAGGLVYHDSTLLVADSNAGRVLVLDAASGEQVGFVEQRLELPRDMAVLTNERIAVVETFARRVAIFDSTGVTLADTVGDERTERLSPGGVLAAPEGVLWDPDALRLYVTDAASGQVKIYNVREEIR